MDEVPNDSIRFSLRQLFAITGLTALALGIASYIPAIGIHLFIGLAGWVMWRVLHGHAAGLVPALLGFDILLCMGIAWALDGSEDPFGARTFVGFVASLLVFAGIGVLVWVGGEKQRFWKCQNAIAVTMLFALVAWWIAAPLLGNAALARRRAVDMAANSQAPAKAIELVEEVRQRTGTTPDEDELTSLLREPLPSLVWDGFPQQIQYRRIDDTSYQLSYLDPSMLLFPDIVIYDSATPNRGWYRVPF